jgi:TetR/AcrR family transcriptional regulator
METKAKIISAAIEIFAEKGKHGARMEKIAEKAKVNKAMLYYYFTSKDLLFKEVLKYIIHTIGKSIVTPMEKILEHTDNPVDILKEYVHAHYQAFSRNVNYTKVLLNALTSSPQEHREAMELEYGLLKSEVALKIEAALRKGISQNIIRDINTKQFIISIIGTNLIYFIAQPIAELILKLEVKDEQTFLKEREESIVDLILFGIMMRNKGSNEQ